MPNSGAPSDDGGTPPPPHSEWRAEVQYAFKYIFVLTGMMHSVKGILSSGAPMLQDVWDMGGDRAWLWGLCGGAVYFFLVLGSVWGRALLERKTLPVRKVVVRTTWFLFAHALAMCLLGPSVPMYAPWGFLLIRSLVGIPHAIVTIWAFVWIACFAYAENVVLWTSGLMASTMIGTFIGYALGTLQNLSSFAKWAINVWYHGSARQTVSPVDVQWRLPFLALTIVEGILAVVMQNMPAEHLDTQAGVQKLKQESEDTENPAPPTIDRTHRRDTLSHAVNPEDLMSPEVTEEPEQSWVVLLQNPTFVVTTAASTLLAFASAPLLNIVVVYLSRKFPGSADSVQFVFLLIAASSGMVGVLGFGLLCRLVRPANEDALTPLQQHLPALKIIAGAGLLAVPVPIVCAYTTDVKVTYACLWLIICLGAGALGPMTAVGAAALQPEQLTQGNQVVMIVMNVFGNALGAIGSSAVGSAMGSIDAEWRVIMFAASAGALLVVATYFVVARQANATGGKTANHAATATKAVAGQAVTEQEVPPATTVLVG